MRNALHDESLRCNDDADETLDDVIVEKIEEIFEPNVVEHNMILLTTAPTKAKATVTATTIEQK